MNLLRKLGSNQTEIEFTSPYHGRVKLLFSYNTPVALEYPDKTAHRTKTKYSKTTTRHINAWMFDKKEAEPVEQCYLSTLWFSEQMNAA